MRSPSSHKDLRPFFSFYGGKWRVTPKHYPKPRHATIVEPFAGSAGFSLRYADRRVVLCEIDPVIASVWRYLIGVSPQEIRSIPDVPLGGSVDDLPVPQEARWLVGFWVNRGVSRPRNKPSRWMREGIRPGSFWGDRVRSSIASQVDSIRHLVRRPTVPGCGKALHLWFEWNRLPGTGGLVSVEGWAGNCLRKRGGLLAPVQAAC